MSARIREHIRSNVYGLIAIFIALGGTAYAVNGPLPGKNQVGSADIINEEVKDQDIGAQAVTFGKIANNAVNSNHIAQGAVTGSEFFARGEVALNFPSMNAGTCSVLTEQRQGTSEAHLLVTPPSHFADTFTLTGKAEAVSLGIVQYKFVACNVFGGGGAADPDSSGGTYRYLVITG